MTTQRFSTNTDRSTYSGGADAATRRIAREQPDQWALHEWLFDHRDTPMSERSNWWKGYDATLDAALFAIEGR